MDKVTLKDLKRDTFRRSTLLAIPDLNNFLALNDNFTPQEVFFGIVKDALQNFEKYVPLFLQTKIFIDTDENHVFKFKDNFEGYLNGAISEDTISLIPSALLGMSLTNDTSSGSLYRVFRYNPPLLTDFWYGKKVYWVSYLANRPIIEDYDPNTNEYTDKCAIYFMTKDLGSEYKYFRDQVYVELCRYLINLKLNLNLQNLPVELFQGLENDLNSVNNELDNFYRNSLTTGLYIK